MSYDEVDLIVKILQNEKNKLSDVEIAKLILTKLEHQKVQKAEVRSKYLEERDKGLDMTASCSGCYRPNFACKC